MVHVVLLLVKFKIPIVIFVGKSILISFRRSMMPYTTYSGIIYLITVPPGPIELRAPDVSDVVFGRTNVTFITISWTPLELEGVDYNTSITPTIPFQTASTTSIVISNVPYNTQYNITVVASNCVGSSMDTISINYS